MEAGAYETDSGGEDDEDMLTIKRLSAKIRHKRELIRLDSIQKRRKNNPVPQGKLGFHTKTMKEALGEVGIEVDTSLNVCYTFMIL